MEEIYIAGGCLWGVQHFFRFIDGVEKTEAGRINGSTTSLDSDYDGYAECVRVLFDKSKISVTNLVEYLFEIIDPYSLNKQGRDVGEKYRTGIYSKQAEHLEEARNYINSRVDSQFIKVEVKEVSNYIKSAEEHQDRLFRCPEDVSYCHLPMQLMEKYKK
ncbi:MAG: peptide-methionine (S)-S-oxide reductase [Gemella sp.]|nr:peptide-methionine (S)-S-oxide reductase [Gemella sp.]